MISIFAFPGTQAAQQGINSLPELLSSMHTVLHVSNVSHFDA